MEKTFGTTCHGAGRAMSRTAALKDGVGRRILSAQRNEWRDRGWCGGILRQPNHHLHTVDRECLRIQAGAIAGDNLRSRMSTKPFRSVLGTAVR